MQKEIAVVIPVYNRATTVLRTLESVCNQTRSPGILITVDDGSKDDSAGAMEKWAKEKDVPFDIRVLRQPKNMGPAAARNRGLQEAKDYEFLAFLDSDDLWPEDFLERAYPALCAHDDAVAASCDRQRIRPNGTLRKLNDNAELAANATRWIMRHAGGVASCTVFRTEFLLKEKGFNEENLFTTEDIELFMPVSLYGPWLHLPGKPIEMDRNTPEKSGEQLNLSRAQKDSFYQWVKAAEGVYASYPACLDKVERGDAYRIFSLLWACSTFQYLRNMQLGKALYCAVVTPIRFLQSIVYSALGLLTKAKS